MKTDQNGLESSYAFREFSEAFERWQWLLPPISSRRDPNEPTYPIELDLDHEVTALATVGARALQGDTRPDWPKIVREYVFDLDLIEKNVAAAVISEEQKKKYQEYISECRLVWQKISLLPVPPNGHLGFRKYVLLGFHFLENSYGFRVTDSTPTKVRYQSAELFVELNYSPHAPELSLELGRLSQAGDEQRSFSLDDLVYWAGLGLRFDYQRFNLELPTGLAKFIDDVAQFVRQYAKPILRNNPPILQSLAAKQEERERRMALG